jgi:hypothetical protein
MSSTWIEDDDAKSFLKQVKDLRDDVSIAKDELPLRLQDAAISNPQLFVKLVDDMIATYESKNVTHRELPLAERMAQSSKKYKRLPGRLRRRRNSANHSLGRRDNLDTASLGSLSKYDSHDTISYSTSDDEASHTSKSVSVVSIGADADAVEIEFALDDNASQSSNVSYASRVAKMIRKLRKRFSDTASLSSELTQDIDEIDSMMEHNSPGKGGIVKSQESGIRNTMSDPSDAKMVKTKQTNYQNANRSTKATRLNRNEEHEMGSKSFPPSQPEKESKSMFRRLFKKKTKGIFNETKKEMPDERPKMSRVPVHITPTNAVMQSRQNPGLQKTKSHSQQKSPSNLPSHKSGKVQSLDATKKSTPVTPATSTHAAPQQRLRDKSDVSLLVAGSRTAQNKSTMKEANLASNSAKMHPSSFPDVVRSFDSDKGSCDEGITDVIDDNSHVVYRSTNRHDISNDQTYRKKKPDPPTLNESKYQSGSLVLGERKMHQNEKVSMLGENMAHVNRNIREPNFDQLGLQIYSPKRSNSPQDLKPLVPKMKDPATREPQELERSVAKKKQATAEPQIVNKKPVSGDKDRSENLVDRSPAHNKYPIEEWKTALRSEDMRQQPRAKKSVRVRSPRRRNRRSKFDDDTSMSSLSFLTNFLDDLDDSLNDAIDRNEAITALFDSYEKMIASRKKAKKKSREEYKRRKENGHSLDQDFLASFDMLDPF